MAAIPATATIAAAKFLTPRATAPPVKPVGCAENVPVGDKLEALNVPLAEVE